MNPIRSFKFWTILLGLIVLLVIGAVLILPYVIEIQSVQRHVERVIFENSGLKVHMEGLKISYLPRPYLYASKIKVKKGAQSFTAEDIIVSPNLLTLLRGGHIPVSSIGFKRGSLGDFLKLDHGEIDFSPSEVIFSSRCELYKMCNFSVSGQVDLHTRSLNAKIEGRKARLDQVLKDIFKFSKLPPTSIGAFKVGIQTRLGAPSPLRITIDRFDVESPALSARGRILIDSSIAEKFFQVDIQANSVNATGVRRILEIAFPKKKAVKETVEIVRGGTLEAFRLRFQGSSEDAKHFKNYEITAKGRNVTIAIPKIDLTINEVEGKVEIKNEVLTGNGLRARLRSTRATDCSIWLKLGGKTKRLRFNGRLKAPDEDILWAVQRFVKERKVLEWATRVSPKGGLATGNLELMGPLKHLHVKVRAVPKRLKAVVSGYPLLFMVDQGEFRLDSQGDKIEIKGCRGTFGKSRWKGAFGTIRWGKKRLVSLEFKGLEADLGEIYSILKNDKALRKRLSPVIEKVNGTIRFDRLRLRFDPKEVGGARYELLPSGGDVELGSPLLPFHVTIKGPRGRIVNEEIMLSHLTLLSQDATELTFKGVKVHHTKGGIDSISATVSGQLNHDVGKWVLKRAHIPTEFSPKLPLVLKDLTLTIKDHTKEIGVEGTIKRPLHDTKGLITLHLKFKKTPHSMALDELHLMGPQSDAKIVFKVEEDLSPKRHGGLTFSFGGKLNGTDLNHLLDKNSLLMGLIRGNLTLKTGDLKRPTITGRLLAKGLLWQWGLRRPVFVQHVVAQPRGNMLELNDIYLEEGASSLGGHALISSGRDGLTIRFDAKTGKVNVDAAISLFGHAPSPKTSKGKEKVVIPQRTKERFKWPRLISDLVMTFDIEEAYFNKKTIREPRGVLEVSKAGKIKIDLLSAYLCGLHTALTMEMSDHTPYTTMKVWTPEDVNLPDFKDTLPCLGMSKEIIDGPIRLNMTLKGRPGAWDQGSFELKGGPGVIRRSNIITKIFSVINVIDLFSRYGNIFTSGLPYSSLVIKGFVKGDEVVIERLVLKAEGLNFFGRGSVYLTPETVDLFVLVSPFKTIDLILSKIPIIGYAIGGKNHTLITVPLKVSGKLKDPSVTILHPEAIGKGMLDLFKSIISIPVRIIVPEGLEKKMTH